MQASQKGVVWTQIVSTIVVIAVLLFSINAMIPNVPTTETIVAGVLAGIVIPEVGEAPNYDTILDKICESDSIDCEGTHVLKEVKEAIALEVFEKGIGDAQVTVPVTYLATEDLVELLNLDKAYIDSSTVFVRYDAEEFEVTTENEDARDDGDFSVKQLIRVSWIDDDLDDTQTAYYVINSIVENYKSTDDTSSDVELDAFEEVERDFEF